MEIDPKTGLPKEAFAWEDIAKTEQRIHVRTEKKKFGKIITIISGLQDVDLKNIAKSLKQELACGGTVKDNEIELQGNHSKRVKPVLAKLGFSEETIEIT
jgi:translation initiation factor 1